MIKCLISGDVIEFYEYSKITLSNGGKRQKNNSEYKEKNYNQTKNNRREYVRRLALSNFNENSTFITLTFKENITDIKQANKLFKNFILRMYYHIGDIKYLAVVEFQDRGAIHYHMLINMPYIEQSKLQKIWQNGFVWINKINNVDNVGAYLVKYMNKQSSDDRLQGQKGYLCSKNLKRWKTVTEWQYINESYQSSKKILDNATRSKFKLIKELLSEVQPVYSSTYENEYIGRSIYKEYNLKRQNLPQNLKNLISKL